MMDRGVAGRREQRQMDEVVRLWEGAAKQGTQWLNNLGVMYEDGQGVDVNYRRRSSGSRRRRSRDSHRLSTILVACTIMARSWM